MIYARDLGPENARLAALFPDRWIFWYEGSFEDGRLFIGRREDLLGSPDR